jgi:hypothetical protein
MATLSPKAKNNTFTRHRVFNGYQEPKGEEQHSTRKRENELSSDPRQEVTLGKIEGTMVVVRGSRTTDFKSTHQMRRKKIDVGKQSRRDEDLGEPPMDRPMRKKQSGSDEGLGEP